MKNDELTEKPIGCAYKVYNTMGFGHLVSVYEKCLIIESQKLMKCNTELLNCNR